MSIGERIIELRKENKLSQGQLAALMNISRQAISKWENDLSSPDTANLIRLADVLDTDVEYLASGRKSYARRPPIVLRSTEVVERIVEKPAIQQPEKPPEQPPQTIIRYVDRPVVEYVEKPVVQYIEKPVVKTVTRVKYLRNPFEFIAVGILSALIGIMISHFL